MFQFITYLVIGFGMAWFSVAMDAIGGGELVIYFSFTGSLLLLLVAAPMALFRPRDAAIVGAVGVLFMALWLTRTGSELLAQIGWVKFGLAWKEHFWNGFGVFGLPAIFATYFVWKTHVEKRMAMRPWGKPVLRVALAPLPAVLFATTFNVPWVLGFFLEGPQGW